MNGFEEKCSPDQISFVLVTYGTCVYWVQGKKVILEKGDALLIPSGFPYYWKTVPTVMHSKYIVEFDCKGVLPLLPVLASRQAVHSKIGCYELVLERMKRVNTQWLDKPSYYDIYAAALFTEIMTLWNRELDRGAASPEKIKHVEAMKLYIQQNYRSKITKEVLGDVIERSPNHAASLFKAVTGQTISEFVHAQRIRTAEYLLTESQLTVGEISEYLGYSDVSYFHRIFRGITGRKPSDDLDERKRLV